MNELIKSISIENFVAQNQRVIELLTKAFELAREASAVASKIGLDAPALFVRSRYGTHETCINGPYARDKEADKIMAETMSRAAWRHLMEESGMKTFMDQKSRREWSTQILEGTVPDLTIENIRSTFDSLHASREEMFIDGVVNLFRGLSWDHKTNSPIKFGKKIIMRMFVDRLGGMYSSSRDKLDDLMRVISLMEGKPEPDHRNSIGSTISRLVMRSGVNAFENDYLAIRWFKAGTAHVVFKKPSIVNELNRILAVRYPNALAYDSI